MNQYGNMKQLISSVFVWMKL